MRRVVLLAAIGSAAACAGVLGLRGERSAPFAHRPHVTRGIACTRCHTDVPAAGDDTPAALPGDDTCTSCHSPPHDPRSCRSCHGDPATAIRVQNDRRHLRFSHAEHLANAPGQCVRCHADVSRPAASLRVRVGACLGCHESDQGSTIERCASCHVDIPDELRPPDSHAVHGDNFARQHGTFAAASPSLCASCHSERFCGGCHGARIGALPWRLDPADPFRPTSVHRAGFLSRHAEESRTQPGTCSTCHSEGFCGSCHSDEGLDAPIDVGRPSPHPPDWVGAGTNNSHGPAARRDPATCAGCHGGAGEKLCVSCHAVGGVGGNPHPPGFSSRKQLSDLPCRLCHDRVGAL